jgi:cytidylate kinase
MYRAVALAGLRKGVDWSEPEQLAALARRIRLEVRGAAIWLEGEDVTEAVRSAEVTAVTRFAADNPQVRAHLVALQQQVADGQDLVTEGRDQGTVVFPQSECKIFLTASAAHRAERRLGDFAARGETRPLEQILADINRRDAEDASRPVGPLCKAADAIEVDTSGKSIDQVVECLVEIVRNRQ